MKVKKQLSFVGRIKRFGHYPGYFKIKVLGSVVKGAIKSLNIFQVMMMNEGFLLYVSPDIFGETIKNKVFDENESKLIKKLDLKKATVYDVGAHHGYYSFLLAKTVGERGRVVSFEPSPRERFYFKISQLLNRFKNISLMPFGVSSRNGNSEFYQVQGDWTGLNSLKPPKDKNYEFVTKKLIVKLVRLDDFLKVWPNPTLIKIDTEGAEFEVIKGASTLIKTSLPLLLMELEDKRTEVWGYKVNKLVQYLEKYEYSIFQITKDGFLKKVSGLKKHEGNYFLMPRNKLKKYKHLILNKV